MCVFFSSVKLFKTAWNYAAPYLKQAGEMIQRIAQPLLESKFGQMAAKGLRKAQEAALYATHRLVDGAEYLIEKASDGLNYVGKKASELVEWIGDTKIVKSMAGLAKNVGNWV